MPTALTPECLRLLDRQDGVIAVGQAVAAGMSAKSVRDQVRAGRWQAMHRGVYAAFTGKPGRTAELWGVLLRAGPDAVLSHQSAAEVWGMLNGVGPVIHVTVPHGSDPDRYGKFAGVVIHRSRSLERARHPALTPPRTRMEETVLDLADCARSFDEAYDWICRAVGRRRTTAARIYAVLETRQRIRWRQEIELALGYARDGALSVLELRYVRGVERPHGLPAAMRQARVWQATGNRYLDNLYAAYRACVEIDGTAAHPEDEQWRDKSRDRWNAAHEGIDTIRIGVLDLINQERQCRTAADVASWLSGRGPASGTPVRAEVPGRIIGRCSDHIWAVITPNNSGGWRVGRRSPIEVAGVWCGGDGWSRGGGWGLVR